MKIGFLIAMNDSEHGLAISGYLSAELSSRINSLGIDASKLSQKSRRDLDLTVYVDCASFDSYSSWPGESTDLDDVVKCWPKLIKPRGFDSLETYIKFNFQKMNSSQDILTDYVLGIRSSAQYIGKHHGIDFNFLDHDGFVESLVLFLRSEPKKFRAENYYKNFHSGPWSKGLVVY